MTLLRPVAIAVCLLMLGGPALAQLQLTPQTADPLAKTGKPPDKRMKTKKIKPPGKASVPDWPSRPPATMPPCPPCL